MLFRSLHRTPTRSAKSSWCRLCNQNDISVTYGVTAAWYFATCHDDAIQLEHGRSMVLIFAYAPTFLAADDDKEAFYDCLNSTIRSVPLRHRLLLLGDFSVHVNHHCHIVAWPNVPGHHSVGRGNSNSALLLETRAKHELVITNTLFQMPNKYKTAWQHPRSKHWHVLD